MSDAEALMAAGDLGREHHGWMIRIPNPNYAPTETLPGPEYRTITLGGVRRWTYDGVERVGLLDLALSGEPWRGTEYNLRADRPVVLKRLIKRVPRPRRGDYPAAVSA